MATARKEHTISKVVALMSMSLDGFVADVDDGVAEVFQWYFASGDVEFRTGWLLVRGTWSRKRPP